MCGATRARPRAARARAEVTFNVYTYSRVLAVKYSRGTLAETSLSPGRPRPWRLAGAPHLVGVWLRVELSRRLSAVSTSCLTRVLISTTKGLTNHAQLTGRFFRLSELPRGTQIVAQWDGRIRNRCPVSGGFYGPGALVSLGRRRRATGRPEKCIFHAHAKKNGQK